MYPLQFDLCICLCALSALLIRYTDASLTFQNSTSFNATSLFSTTTASSCTSYECQLSIGYVDVFYWAVSSSNTDCLKDIDTSYYNRQSSVTQEQRLAVRQGNIQNNNASIYVNKDGFTYTSPYAYAIFPHVSAVDNCGSTVGKAYTFLTFSFAPGELSTGEPIRGARAGPFNFADLPCPPASVASENWYYYRSGMPYHPNIIPPPQILNLNPAFSHCFAYPGSIVDPPVALTPQAVLSPFTTPADGNEQAPSTAAMPKSTIPAPEPVRTPVSSSAMDDPKTTVPAQDPASQTSIHSSEPVWVPPAQSTALGDSTKQNAASDPPSPNLSPTTLPTSTLVRPQQVTPNSSFAQPLPEIIAQGQTLTLNAPVITIDGSPVRYSAGSLYVGTQVTAVASSPSQPEEARPIAIGGLSFSVIPSEASTAFSNVPIAAESIQPGVPPITIAGSPISLGTDALVIGSETVPIRVLDSPSPITSNGQVYNSQPSSISIDGTTIAVGGPAIIILGKTISLDPIGGVVLYTSGATYAPQSLPSTGPLKPQPLSIISVGGERITVQPTGFSIDGTRIQPGGEGITVSGIYVSLDTDGNDIVIGSSTLPLAATPTGAELGGLIMSAFSTPGQQQPPLPTATASSVDVNSTPSVFLGQAAVPGKGVWWVALGFFLAMCVFLLDCI